MKRSIVIGTERGRVMDGRRRGSKDGGDGVGRLDDWSYRSE